MAQGRGNAVVFGVAVLALLRVVASKDYTVGDTDGWTYPSGASSYDNWAAKQNFLPGDNLVFKFDSIMHDVQVVSAAEEAGCLPSTGKKYTSGADTIPLTKAGDYYFLCSFQGHCEQGMKMKLTVKAEAATPPSTPPVAASPPPTTTSPPAKAPTTPPATPPATPPVAAPAPAPVVQAPTPAPVIAPVPSPVPVPAPVPEVAPTPVPVVAPTPEVVIPTTPAAAPAPAASSSQSVRVCLSFVGAAIVAAFGALLF